MRASIIGRLFQKEVLSTFRDRRAMFFTLIFPLVMIPLFMVGFPALIGGLMQSTSETSSPIGVVGEANLPGEFTTLLKAQNITLSPVTDPLTAVQNGDYEAAIKVPADFQEQIKQGGKVGLELYSKQGNMKSELVAGKIQTAVSAYQKEIVASRLKAAGLSEAVLTPFTVTTVDASSKAETGAGVLGWLIPYFIALFVLTGGQATAIDATAGEKERGTLESLLVAPVRRSEVVVAKTMATMTYGLGASIMGIIGYSISGVLVRALLGSGDVPSAFVGSFHFSPTILLMLLVSAILMAGFISSLVIGIAIFAKSYKQAQSYIAPLAMIIVIPAVGLQFADFFSFGNAIYLVPILNILLLMNDVMKGIATPLHAILTWGSTLVYAGLLLSFAYRNFRREDVLFRT
jgi:sodium transport system permease protein